MIRLIFRFAVLVLLAAGFAWLADNPGTVTMVWRGKEIQTSVAVAAAFALAAVFLLLFIWSLLRRLWRSPRAVGQYWQFRKNRKGYESLSRGIIAAGAGDAAAAAKHAAIAGNALADEPLVNVLAAQAAQLKGDRAAVKRIFADMAKTPETEALGLRGLFLESKQAGDIEGARQHAERALRLNPRLAWASSAVLQLNTASRNWNAAATTLAQQVKSGIVPATEGNRKQAALLAAEALALEEKDATRALDHATRALKLDPGLVPAALVAARIHIAQNSQRKASRILKEAWARSPHPDLAAVFAHLKPGDGPEARYERVRDLVAGTQNNIEASYALARAAVEAQRWDVARDALKPWLDSQPQVRVCALMADIEDAQGDKGRAREWLARAVNAARDPIWVSDGVASLRWTPVSPVSGEIVACEWKAPFEMPAELPKPDTAAPSKAMILPSAATEAPRTVSFQRPPDDPGVDDGPQAPEAAARRSLAAEG